MKRYVLIPLAILFVATVGFAGGQGETAGTAGDSVAVTPAGVFPVVEQPITTSAFAPLEGPAGTCYARYTPNYGWNNYYITNKAKNPAAAFRLGDYMYTAEYSVWNGRGMEGDSWTDPDPGAAGLDGVAPATRKQIKSWGTGDPLAWWNQLGSFLQSPEVRWGAQRSQNPSDLEVILFDETKKNYEPFTPPMSMIVPPLTYGEDVSAELSELETTLTEFVNETTARFITGDLDIDSGDWDWFQRERQTIGVDRYVEIKQAAYEASAFYDN